MLETCILSMILTLPGINSPHYVAVPNAEARAEKTDARQIN